MTKEATKKHFEHLYTKEELANPSVNKKMLRRVPFQVIEENNRDLCKEISGFVLIKAI